MAEPIDHRIVEFITAHHVLTLAVSLQDIPWCSSCFYCYLPDYTMFIFTSDEETRHIRDFRASGKEEVSGSIALETNISGKIRGLQFSGRMHQLEGELLHVSRQAYLNRFPIARLSPLHLWGVVPYLLKFTDNRLGFGKKLYWRDST